MSELAFVIGAYLLGSVSFGILMSRAFGLPDPRTVGSGNPGATNVLRSGKKLAAALTLFGDAAKGWVAVRLALDLQTYFSWASWVVCIIGLAVFIGHLYPIYYSFKGGKGVATALGIMLAFSVWLGLAVLLTWVAVFAISRYSSLSALVASWLAPAHALVLLSYKGYAITALFIAILITWRHRSNIKNLIDGTESGFGKKK
jgi:glycerol-3-phosphate acyltransferase PlsY